MDLIDLPLKGQAALHPKFVAIKQREIINQRPQKPPDTRINAEIVNFINLTLKGQAALHPKVVAKKPVSYTHLTLPTIYSV